MEKAARIAYRWGQDGFDLRGDKDQYLYGGDWHDGRSARDVTAFLSHVVKNGIAIFSAVYSRTYVRLVSLLDL